MLDNLINENAGLNAASRVTSIESRVSSKWGTQRGSSVYSSQTEADSANVSSLSKWTDNQSEKPEVSNQSALTDVLSDPENQTPTNAVQPTYVILEMRINSRSFKI